MPESPVTGRRALEGRRHARLAAVILTALSLLTILAAWRTAANALYPHPLDVGEGTALTAKWLASAGKPFYNEIAAPPYDICVYNPLEIACGGLAMRLAGPAPLGPRLLGATFMAGAAALIWLFVRRETSGGAAAWIAALFFLVERHVYSRAGYAVVDYAAIFWSVLGIYLWRRSGRMQIAAIAVFVLAFFSKQTSLIAAAACFSALFLEGRRARAAAFFALFAALVTAGLLLCAALFGKPYFLNAYRYVSTAPIQIKIALRNMAIAVGLYPVLFCGGLSLAVLSLRRKGLILPAAYLVFATAAGLASGKLGASRSYFFDYAAALSIMAGLLWAKFAAARPKTALKFLLAAAVTFQLFLVALGTLHKLSPAGDRTESDRRHDALIRKVFVENEGLIFCREPGFDIGAGARNVGTDMYQMRLLIDGGLFSEDILMEPLKNRIPTLVIMPEKETSWTLFSPEVRAVVEKHYRLERREAGELFFVPRRDGAVGEL